MIEVSILLKEIGSTVITPDKVKWVKIEEN